MDRDLNINYISETNYNVVDEKCDIWNGELPYKTGDTFPTQKIKDRASISKTNRLIYENDVNDIFGSIISIFPEIDPIYGWQIREIMTNLPYFKNITNSWVGLVAGEKPMIDTDDEKDVQLSEIIESSNLTMMMQQEVRSRFIDTISAWRADIDIEGNPTAIMIDPKNLIVFISREYTTSIEVTVVFNIYKDEQNKEYCEFVEYHYNGLIRKRVFEYGNGKLGRELEELKEEEQAFNGKFKMSPVVVFKHNTTGNNIYGTDQYRYWSASILGAMRELQNIFRLCERTREMIRMVPDSSIKKDGATGDSVFFNRGTIGYKQGTPENERVRAEYAVPNIPMDEAIKAFEKAVKGISTDTQLGVAFFDIEKLGSRISADGIRASLYPTQVEAKRITSEMYSSLQDLIVRLCAMKNMEIKKSQLRINFYDGFPVDQLALTQAISMRINGKIQTISREDAIMALDRVPLRIAKQKALEIERESNGTYETDLTTVEKERELEDKVDNSESDITNAHEINLTAGKSNEVQDYRYKDDTLWEYEMNPVPRNKIGNKGMKKWAERKLRQNH